MVSIICLIDKESNMPSIKHLKPNLNSKFKQGYFENAKKYTGPLPIIYRSSYEFRFIQKLELNPNVEKWSSENIQIPYFLMERQPNGKFKQVKHTYNVDYTVWLKNGSKYVIEVKPLAFVPLNESQIKRNPVMYKNYMKWKYATEWCKQNGFQFKVVTERELSTSVFG